MAQINLLKQNNSSSTGKNISPKLAVQVLSAVFICLLGYYGFMFLNIRSINGKIFDTETLIQNDIAASMQIKERPELFTRQEQLKNLQDLVAGHLYWSQIFPEIAKTTLKKSTYTTLKLSPPNSLSMTVKVPTLQDMDKYMQVFDLPEFNKNFSNVRIAGYNKSVNASSTQIQFNVLMDYNPAILNYTK